MLDISGDRLQGLHRGAVAMVGSEIVGLAAAPLRASASSGLGKVLFEDSLDIDATKTSSLTTTPPLSSWSFKLTLKSWRLIRVAAENPTRCMVPLLTPSTQ